MTKEQAEAHQRRHGFLQPLSEQPEYRDAVAAASQEPKPRRRRKKTIPELEMEFVLQRQKEAGEIISYRYEGWRMKWGEDPKTGAAMWYKPDFVVFLPTTRLWMCKVIETKGPWISSRDLVRFKGARAAWPEVIFEMWQRDKEGRWTKLH